MLKKIREWFNPTNKLKEELQQAKFQAEIAKHKLTRQIAESYNYGEIINPLDQFYSGQELIFPFTPNRLDYRYNWISEGLLDLIRSKCRWLVWYISTARGLLEGYTNFCMKGGFRYEVQGKRNSTISNEKILEVQKLLDEFLEANCWRKLETQVFFKTRRDGEYFLELFTPEDEPVQLRTIKPEFIRSPSGSSPEWSYGIRTEVDDCETILEYAVYGREERVPADRMWHCKVNDDMVDKRGISDFFPVMESINNIRKLTNATILGESARSAIAYIVEFEQASMEVVNGLQVNDATIPVTNNFGISRQENVERIVPGTVKSIPQGMKFTQPPQGNVPSSIAILDACLEQVAQRWQCPKWMASGDASSDSYASALVSETPFTRAVEAAQLAFGEECKELMMQVLNIYAEQGKIDEEDLEEMEISAIAPNVVARQSDKESLRMQMLHQEGLLSKRTWSNLESLDYENEQANFKEDEGGTPEEKQPEPQPTNPEMQQVKDDNKKMRQTDLTRNAE